MANEKVEKLVAEKATMEAELKKLEDKAHEVTDHYITTMRATVKEFTHDEMKELLDYDNEKFDETDKHAAVISYLESHDHLGPALLMLLLSF